MRHALALAVVSAAVAGPALAAEAPPTRHELAVRLDPPRRRIAVSSTTSGPSGTVDFLLNGKLAVTKARPAVVEVPLGDVAPFFGNNGTVERPGAALPLKRYRVTLPPGSALSLEYEGPIDVPLSDPKEQYTRGFRDTPGLVGPEGVYLAGSSFWLPYLGESLVSFRMEARGPEGWQLVSQGSGTSRGADGVARWDSNGPVDEVYVVGGPLRVFRDRAGSVETLVYLHEADDALASKYLAATAQYLEMYRALIGPYPYGKFALVENFWETGYGMASFTLLGPQVVRFPFILHSSYPHEILHNWWGNSVFVDYASGNWCEGLTAYLADHLVQEQRGKGDEYRRGTLQKYRDYVKGERDFPLTEFRSRHSAATEAVGYGKSLMTFHMLRRHVGDAAFRKGLAALYAGRRGAKATFGDLEKAFAAASGKDLRWLFAGFVERAGAPALAVASARAAKAADGWEVDLALRQTQDGPPFVIDVPVAVATAGKPVVQTVRMDGREVRVTLKAPDEPLAVQVDPMFDVFRRLDPRETPPSIGQVFGSSRVLAVLPDGAPGDELAAFRSLVLSWQSESHAVEVVSAAEVKDLPADRAVWLLGRRNPLAPGLFPSSPELALGESELAAGGEKMPLVGHTAILTARSPKSPDATVGWIFTDTLEALPGLGRKLPHYGKYSFLGFEGTEPVNVLKGQWSGADSPLRVDLRPLAARKEPLAAVPAETRRALAELPPAFSQKALGAHVAFLAAPERQGRGLGSKGLDEATAYVAERFKEYGLGPGGEGGRTVVSAGAHPAADGKQAPLANVVGVVKGTKPEWKDQSVVVCAHLDHLGHGWPDVHKGDEGKVHPGADDNASGVAVLLELARTLASEKPKRSVVFAVFTGEESGRLGSKAYVAAPGPYPAAGAIAAINLDTVGRLGSQKLTVIASGTATEWPHIFRGASFVTGVETKAVAESLESSDQLSFIEKGVPAVQLFTGAHEDYHRPGDTPEKVDVPGLAKVAAVAKEAITYLADRSERLNVTIPAAGGKPAAPAAGGAPPSGGRRVSFGTVPDFAFEGPGVKVDSVVAGSPAEKAGVAAGDVLLALDGRAIGSLKEYSDLLRTFAPGQTVTASVRRGDKELALKVTLAER